MISYSTKKYSCILYIKNKARVTDQRINTQMCD